MSDGKESEQAAELRPLYPEMDLTKGLAAELRRHAAALGSALQGLVDGFGGAAELCTGRGVVSVQVGAKRRVFLLVVGSPASSGRRDPRRRSSRWSARSPPGVTACPSTSTCRVSPS
ncbi:hypothetical protein GXW82_10705 [Streptacidiphilus sp. 4-A2]|nr:hypothetical protein [Streptacidiphilus sp. 4-A2]